MTDRFVVGKISLGPTIRPIGWSPTTKDKPDKKLTRLLHAARGYRDGRSQVTLDELLAAAKDID